MAPIKVPVLIVGAGPVGLGTALGLTKQGVEWLLVERRISRTTIQPRARGIKVRTMEIFRAWGVDHEVAAAGLPAEKSRFMLWVTTLAGDELRRVARPALTEEAREQSPTEGCNCPQDAFEPILLDHALAAGTGRALFGHELVALDQDASAVRATIVDRATHGELIVHPRYLVAADGERSRVRPSLGVRVEGPGTLSHHARIIFRADLRQLVAGRESVVYWIQNPTLSAVLLPINQSDRWELSVPYEPTRGETLDDFTRERCADLARHAIGVPDLSVQILDVSSYPMAAGVAERFRAGRVFLAGDAAHVMPATGAYGMNTGMQDAHNLAWKLAAVLQGWADPSLLDTYDAERRPVGVANTEQAVRNAASVAPVPGQGAAAPSSGPRGRSEMFSDQGLFLGYSYASAAVIPDGTAGPVVANPVTDYVPTARPGHRAPHVWLERGGERISTLDLFDTAFTLLAGPSGTAWCGAAETVARSLGVPLRASTVGTGGDVVDPEGSWTEVYDVEPTGAVLVRPDGHVAWRSRSRRDDPHVALDRAVRGVLGRRLEEPER